MENEDKNAPLTSPEITQSAQELAPSSVRESQPDIPKKEKKLFKIAVLVLIPIIFIAFGGVGYFFHHSKISENLSLSIKPSPSPIPRVQYKKYHWKLKRTTDSGEELISTFSDTEVTENWMIARWQNLLFYGSEMYSSKVELFSHNLDTGETNVIYEELTQEKGISDIQVIDNTLFFSVGGYLAEGATYWLDLPPTRKPQKLVEGSNGRVEFIRGQYFLIQGEGDACWGFASYSLLNVDTKSVTSIAETNTGCSEGEEYIGIDKRNRMILSFHTPDFGGYEEGGEDGIYTDIVAIPISNPNSKKTIISKENMPPDIRALKYSGEQDKIFMLGKTSYSLNLENNLIEKVTTIPDEWVTSSINSWEGETVCLKNYSTEKVAGINLETNIFNEGIDVCQPIPQLPYQETQKVKAEEIITSLDLPPNYRFELEEYN